MEHDSSENKTSLIRYICAADSLPSGLTLVGEDIIFEHEEGDAKLISYLLHASPHKTHIQVLSDDTDIFVLLVYFTWYYNPTAKISMKKYNGQFIDINATLSKYGDKCSNILATHSLSGCDSVSYPYRKGKTTAFNMMLNFDVDISKFTDLLCH